MFADVFAKCGQHRSKVGQLGPAVGPKRPILAESGQVFLQTCPNSTETCPTLPCSPIWGKNVWPSWASTGQNLTSVGQVWQHVAKLWPSLAKFAPDRPMSVEAGQHVVNLVQSCSATTGQLWISPIVPRGSFREAWRATCPQLSGEFNLCHTRPVQGRRHHNTKVAKALGGLAVATSRSGGAAL